MTHTQQQKETAFIALAQFLRPVVVMCVFRAGKYIHLMHVTPPKTWELGCVLYVISSPLLTFVLRQVV